MFTSRNLTDESLSQKLTSNSKLKVKTGLDFTLSYSAAGKNRKRTLKKPSSKTFQDYGDECDVKIELENFDDLKSIDNALFMMETSGGNSEFDIILKLRIQNI